MLENSLLTFSNELFLFLTKAEKPNKSLLIKKHSQNLQKQGDMSFPKCLKYWQQYVNSNELNNSISTILEYSGTKPDQLVTESKSWCLHVIDIKVDESHIYLWLDRPNSIRVGLLEALNNTVFISNRCHIENCFEESNDLTSLRLKYLNRTVQNLYKLSVIQEENSEKIIVARRNSIKSGNGRLVICGEVLNAKTGAKDLTITEKDLIESRQNEMSLIAQHKYGVRVASDSKWKDFIAHLGESSVIFELLQTKPNADVKINFQCSAGSSKGASFVLYNCARLETLVRTFNEKVEEGLYPPLPDIKDTDLSLLIHEDEWCLIFNYILGLSHLLKRCTDIEETSCEFRPHLICTFLSAMSKTFSQYYRKVRILTESRKHLLAVLFARMHLVIVLNNILKACLRILNIQSVTQM